MQLLFGYCTHHSEQKKLHKIATCRRGFLACQHGLPIHLTIEGAEQGGRLKFRCQQHLSEMSCDCQASDASQGEKCATGEVSAQSSSSVVVYRLKRFAIFDVRNEIASCKRNFIYCAKPRPIFRGLHNLVKEKLQLAFA